MTPPPHPPAVHPAPLREGPGPWAAAASRALHPSRPRTGAPGPADAPARSTRPTRPGGPDGGETADWLWSVASGLAGVTVPWELRQDDGPPPTERVWDLLLSTPDYEVWAICWPAGTGLEMHDHGPSAGAFCLVAGELVETVVDLDGVTEHRHWGPGQGSLFAPGVAHQVVNEGTATATTVHVYSPPLSSMTFYDGDGPPAGDGVAGRDPVTEEGAR